MEATSESWVKKTIGAALEVTGSAIKEGLSNQRLVGTDVKGWLGNGLQELQQLGVPSVEQIQPGTNPTLGYVTTGEVTAERLGEPDAAADQLYGQPPHGPAKDGPEPEM